MPVDISLLAAFAAASFLLLAVPGPTIVMVISQALAHGRKVAIASVLGVGLGDLAAATLSLIGVGTILATSATAFIAIKWIGAAYLVWIGIKMWHAPAAPMEIDEDTTGKNKHSLPVFRDAFLVTLFNPKGIVFFVAFVPQFMTAEKAFMPQATVLITTFVILGMINAAVYALLASSARDWIKQPSVLRAATRTGAAFLVSAGIASVFVKRAS